MFDKYINKKIYRQTIQRIYSVIGKVVVFQIGKLFITKTFYPKFKETN